MAKVKTYWDTIKNNETFYHGGSRGWEVHLRKYTHYMWDRKTGTEKKVEKLVVPSVDTTKLLLVVPIGVIVAVVLGVTENLVIPL